MKFIPALLLTCAIVTVAGVAANLITGWPDSEVAGVFFIAGWVGGLLAPRVAVGI